MGHRTQAHYCPALIHAVSLDGLERRLADVVALVGKRGLHGPAGIFLIATKRWSRLRPFRRHRPFSGAWCFLCRRRLAGRPRAELHVLRDDLRRFASDAVLIRPAPRFEAAFDETSDPL